MFGLNGYAQLRPQQARKRVRTIHSPGLRFSGGTRSALQAMAAMLTCVLLMACSAAPTAPHHAVADLAPTGKLRAAINLGNPILARQDPVTGEALGVSVDLARELAKRLGVEA